VLQTLRQRESGTARLENAVSLFRAALEEMPRDRVPLDWATTLNNLGNTLQILGQRESGTAPLPLENTSFSQSTRFSPVLETGASSFSEAPWVWFSPRFFRADQAGAGPQRLNGRYAKADSACRSPRSAKADAASHPDRFLIAAGSLGPGAADQPDTVKAVTPGGPGVLTKCRGWLVTTTCRTYSHISLPSRSAVGDTITILFGSHPKEFGFFVARIDLKGQHCAIFSEAEGDRHRMDKIDVAPCHPADEGR